MNTGNIRIYRESVGENLPGEIYSEIDGDRYSVIAEGIYEKKIMSGTINIGLKHTQGYTVNEYLGSVNNRTKMEQAKTYFYTEYQAKLQKFSYAVGLGGARSRLIQKNEDDYEYYTFKPSLRMGYNFSPQFQLRYRFTVSNESPSLGQLSATEQLIDTMQLRRGNPLLTPYVRYYNMITADLNKGIFSSNLFFRIHI
ncbi:MAG: outer membrane beta-barrel family protein [Tannerellaceae bacterium]|nr:outer membrane beta-barrel family protein [Tannerellaceae bacterium]MCD8265078.1 outer membrane beta-barrel family protein [Tannerellaceae bacterium]